jgi:hypothetical protein
VLLQLALDWLEVQPFSGSKTDADQELEFPRDGNADVPDAIVTAQLACALIIDQGGNPGGEIGQRVLREKVDVIEVQYSDKGNQTTIYPRLNALLRPYLTSSASSFQFVVHRA